MRQYHETEKKEIQKLAKMYREFLDAGKTERECSSNICRIAKEQGFENLEDVIREGKQLKAGDKIYAENMKKSVIMMEIGTDDIENGMLLIGSHIDSPRLDMKQNPLYEDTDSFDPSVSRDAVEDTAENLKLAIKLRDKFFPLRDTAYKSLLDRAKIGGSALPKLSREKLADVINACLALHKDSALLLLSLIHI